MKPHRIRMTHNLLLNYGLYRKMEIYVNNFSFEKNFFFQMSVWFLIGFIQICSVHIKPPRMKWPNSIQTIIFDSFDPFGQTTCPNITSRCSDVSKIYTNLSSCCVWWSFLTHFFGFSIFFVMFSQCRWRLSSIWWLVWILSAIGWWFCSSRCQIEQTSIRNLYKLGRWFASC